MRRKSKKVKEEVKESSTERRSKRSSTRRKRAYEDDEGGSGVEEERTTEEEMTPTKTKERGGRRYATRGRRQKAEESEEEEASQAEEERVDLEEESSNNLPVETEADDKETEILDRGDDSKGLKSGVTVSDQTITSEGNDGASARKSDSKSREMKAGKNDQEDKTGGIAEETPAQGEGDDGEEEGSRSHSRKRKLKLSRDCLQENREAIPKIRLRLSRNRSGGYETEKLEAERIETKRADEERLIQVIKVDSAVEEKEDVDNKQSVSNEQAEVVELKKESEEVVHQDSEEVDNGKVEVEREEGQEEEEREASPKVEEYSGSSTGETPAEEERAKTEVEIEEIRTDDVVESTVSDGADETVNEGVVEFPTDEVEKRTEKESEAIMEVEDSVQAEEVESTSVSPVKKEDENVEQEVVSEKPVEVPSETRDSEGEGRVVKESEEKQVSGGGEVSDQVIEEEKEVEETRASDSEKPKDCEKEASGGAEEVAKREAEKAKIKAKLVEIEELVKRKAEVAKVQADVAKIGPEVAEIEVELVKVLEVVKGEVEVKEVAEEVKDEAKEVVEDSESVKVDEVPIEKETEEIESVRKDEDGNKDSKSVKTLGDEGKLPNEGECELAKEERDREDQDHKSGGAERASRINRTKLRQDHDVGEEHQNQKRRRRRRSRSRESSSSENRRPSITSASDAPQPKRVSLKRPKLVRSASSAPVKVSTPTEEKEEKELIPKVEERNEEESQPETITEEPTQIIANEENKPIDQSTTAEDGNKKRRRKWGQQKSQVGTSQSKRAFISISTQSLKGLIPEVTPLPIHELRLSVEKDDAKDICMEEEESCEASVDETIVRMIDANGQNERTVWAQVVDDEMRTSIHPEAPRVPSLGAADAPTSAGPVRRISIVSDDAVRLQRSPSPPRHPPSSVLFLSNLVRPFTVQQLKELLARTGTVVEGGFWIDRIKSMCLVQYETEEQARETRHALHGVRWPISNPKRLWVDFATKDRLEEAKREGNVPPPPPAVDQSLTPPLPSPRDDFPRKTEPLRVDGSGMVPIHHPAHRATPGSPGRQGHAMILQQGPITGPVAEGPSTENVAWQQRGRPRPDAPPLRPGANARDFKLSAPVREWDLDKVVQQSPPRTGMHGPARGPVDDRRRPETAGQPAGRRDRMLPSPPPSLQEMQVRKAKRKEAEAAAAAAAEAPANLLDSLFRKTKATPSIYWLPLTAEQIKVKEEIRRQHLAEHERRMAEMKRAAEKERGGRRRRRSSSPRRRSRRQSGEGSSAVRKKPSESMKGHKAGSASPKK